MPIEIQRYEGGPWEERLISIDDHPLMFTLPLYRHPAILRGEPKTPVHVGTNMYTVKIWDEHQKTQQDLKDIADKFNAHSARIISCADDHHLCMMLAKIAHSYSIAELGNIFKPKLLDIILRKDNVYSHLIGGSRTIEPESEELHEVGFEFGKFNNPSLLIVRVRLFSCLKTPTYYVVVGELQM